MKALVYLGPGSMEYQESPEPRASLILEVLGSGICGTDIKTFRKGHHMFTPPTILGHECIGRVIAAPAGCAVELGQSVAVAPYIECGTCPSCRKGLGQLCKAKSYVSGGCFAEYLGMDADYARQGLFPIAGPDPVYTLCEPLACVINGMEKLRLDAGRRVLVVGAGPMGSLFGAMLESRGQDFAIVETSAARRSLIARWGWPVIGPNEVKQGDFDQIVLTVNSTELITTCLSLAADGGNLLLFSGFARADRAMVDPYDIHYREVSMTGTFGYARHHFVQALEVLKSEAPRFGRIITHRLPLASWERAMELLDRGEAMKIVLEP